MARARLPEAKIREILGENSSGTPVSELVKKHKISSATFYNWKSRFGDKTEGAPKRGRPAGSKNAPKAAIAGGGSSGDENRRLKVMVVDLMLQVEQLKEQLSRR